ncbi:MAG: tRNA (adenosine(37)-N6)-dimethylallyltransferase MiaA [Ferruginibacter sp.]|nr:tRNA (adenosine(37)-N6)-dimethylallyltransferase MiaA [Cytophagales bacterium]
MNARPTPAPIPAVASANHLLVIAGPTAVGKTGVGIRLAQELGTDILSADSRQFYRELTIGTAKPTAAEMRRVPHHFVDSHSIGEDYNAGAFERDALQRLAEIFRRKTTAVAVGGSGLYLKLLCDGMDAVPAVRLGVREALIARLDGEGLPALQQQLRVLDPAYYATVDLRNPQRVIRALEVCLGTGLPYSSFRQNQPAPRPFRITKIALNRDRADLYDRIDRRMEAMLAQGLVGEARSLWPYRHHNALQTVGYSEVFGFLDGQYGEAEMVRLLKQNSRRYAKRQLTWFRRQEGYAWFHADDYAGVRAYVREKISEE